MMGCCCKADYVYPIFITQKENIDKRTDFIGWKVKIERSVVHQLRQQGYFVEHTIYTGERPVCSGFRIPFFEYSRSQCPTKLLFWFRESPQGERREAIVSPETELLEWVRDAPKSTISMNGIYN